jgi:hypothetical protein
MKKILYVLLAFSVLIVGNSFAQTVTGKLAGKVTDARTGDPLPGANILLVGTELGAATNARGEYFILNILPGTYEVRVSFVGYATETISGVRVVAGITKDLNADLEEATAELREITVTSERTFFEQKATNTVKVVDKEEIARLPVKGVEKIASLQAGVVISEGSGGVDGVASINVKGGRGNEVLYIVDGVIQNDPYGGGHSGQVSNSAIEQLSFQIGGFEAKYGQAQSGIVNVTTRSGAGSYTVFGDVLTSSFTDDFGYNLYTLNLSGPFIPRNNKHTFFILGERGWFLDQDPPAVPLEVGSAIRTGGQLTVGGKPWVAGEQVIGPVKLENVTMMDNNILNYRPNNDRAIWRFTGKTFHDLGFLTLRLGANINLTDRKIFVYDFVKSNSSRNPLYSQENYSYSARLSRNFGASSFMNLNFGWRKFNDEQMDPLFKRNLEWYGDTLYNAWMKYWKVPQGVFVAQDSIGIFRNEGGFNNVYYKNDNNSFQIDFDFTSQLQNHLFELGAGVQFHEFKYYYINPRILANRNRGATALTKKERYMVARPTYWGYDLYGGDSKVEADSFLTPRKAMSWYGYFQDRFELSDLVINVGIRLDYFDSKADIIRDPEKPFRFGNPNILDAADYIKKEPEFYISPRIGIGFPVTASTVFHAQYGKFIQSPNLNNIYGTRREFEVLLVDGNRPANNGAIISEETTQYEVGFRQIFGDNLAALSLGAFYKNTKGLVNYSTTWFTRPTGEVNTYFGPSNTDFGTIKGLTLTLDIARMQFAAMTVNYTYQIAEGTGSSTSSSYVATFRNVDYSVPIVIAPLDFDQRHTGTVNLDFFVPEGKLGFLERTGMNVLFTFASGRPYTPLEEQDLLAGSTNYGDTKGYVNSRFGPGMFRIDLKLEKTFKLFGDMLITPYLWIDNLLDADNTVSVYRSTGNPFTTGFLNTERGQKTLLDVKYPAYYKSDYELLEKNPGNWGIPRQIRLGLKVNFSGINF